MDVSYGSAIGEIGGVMRASVIAVVSVLMTVGLAAPAAYAAIGTDEQHGSDVARPLVGDPALQSALLISRRDAPLRLVVPQSSASDLAREGFEIGEAVGSLPFTRASATPLEVEAAAQAGLAGGVALDALIPHPMRAAEVGPRNDTDIDWAGVTGAQALQARGFTGRGTAIAVIDSGIQASHPYFRGADGRSRVVAESCFVQNEWFTPDFPCPGGGATAIGPGAADTGSRTDVPWPHGTHVAGIAAGNAAQATGAKGFTGMVPDANLVISRVFGFGGAWTSDIAQALDWVAGLAATHNVSAVNLSLGSPSTRYFECSGDGMYLAVTSKLRAAGVAIVASSGNDSNPMFIGSPACTSGWVSVGATDWLGRVANFSNVSENIDIMAPGQNLWSSVPVNDFASYAGTSMASPVVAGAFGLMRQAMPSTSPDAVLTAMRATGPPIDDIVVKDLPTLRVDRVYNLLADRSYPAMATDVRVATTPTSVTVSWSVAESGARPTSFDVRLGARTMTTTSMSYTFEGVTQSDLAVSVTPRSGDTIGVATRGPTAFAVSTAIPQVISEVGTGYAADFCPGGEAAASFAYPKAGTDPGPRSLRLTAGRTGEGAWEYDRMSSASLYRFDVADVRIADAPDFAVQAWAGDSVSPTQYVSDLIERIPGGLPGTPTRLTGKVKVGAVDLAWRPQGATRWRVLVDGKVAATTTEPRATVTSLGGEHEVAVCALGDSGSTSRAARLSVDVPSRPEAPSAPLGVTAVPGNGQATITWREPESDGGSPITGYRVTASPGGAQCGTTGALTCTVTGLVNGTSYAFTATATNEGGTSPASAASAPVTPLAPITKPGPVTNLKAKPARGILRISWAPPVDKGGATSVSYQYRVGTGAWISTSATAMTVTGRKGARISVGVRAVNEAGPGGIVTVTGVPL